MLEYTKLALNTVDLGFGAENKVLDHPCKTPEVCR